jgi:hypothetical protein
MFELNSFAVMSLLPRFFKDGDRSGKQGIIAQVETGQFAIAGLVQLAGPPMLLQDFDRPLFLPDRRVGVGDLHHQIGAAILRKNLFPRPNRLVDSGEKKEDVSAQLRALQIRRELIQHRHRLPQFVRPVPTVERPENKIELFGSLCPQIPRLLSVEPGLLLPSPSQRCLGRRLKVPRVGAT